ncbi:hypothetical protein F4604DRAFT_1933076 [Suillus subluteus]|nr:hypothetical protein F4604DRAFT_1933076 [Suillus subluteus]
MGKYDHIVELTSTDEYPSWRRGVVLALKGEGLWNHCSTGTDPNNFAEYASVMPTAANPGTPTAAEKQAIIDWVKEDAQTKGIIYESSTARQQWDVLAMHFGWLDISSQFELRAQLFAEKLKDADDVSCYISVFEHARRCFAEMAITFTDGEAVFLLLQGLLQTPEWIIFKCMTMTSYSNLSSSLLVSAPSSSTVVAAPQMTFLSIAASLSEEANRIRTERKLSGPGSEYSNAVSDPKANQKIGACHAHSRTIVITAFSPEEEWRPFKKDIAAAATSDAAKTKTPPSPTQSDSELACAIIEEILDDSDSLPSVEDIACIVRQTMSTILNSGTTSTLITDQEFFGPSPLIPA